MHTRTLQKYTFISFNLHDEEMSMSTEDIMCTTTNTIYANVRHRVRFSINIFTYK